MRTTLQKIFGKRIDIAVLLILPLAGSLLSFATKTNAFWGTLIFLGAPAAYLSLRERDHIKKAALFSLLVTPIIILVDYIADITQTWLIPNSILNYRLFGFVTLEVILWFILNIYLAVMFYEHFLDKHITDKAWRPRLKYLLIIVSIIFLFFIIFLFGSYKLIYVPYWYLASGAVFILLPILLQAINFPRVFYKIIKVAVYFFYLTFIFEVTALKLGWWIFPGKEYVGWVSVSGVKFPLEEFVFWFILFALAVLSIYEYYDDDER